MVTLWHNIGIAGTTALRLVVENTTALALFLINEHFTGIEKQYYTIHKPSIFKYSFSFIVGYVFHSHLTAFLTHKLHLQTFAKLRHLYSCG